MTDSFVDLDALWGGSIESSSVDLPEHTLTLEIVVPDLDVTCRYRLSFLGLRSVDLRFADGDLPWTYAELTSIDVTKQPNGLAVEVELWSPDSLLRVECATYELRLVDRSASEAEIPPAEDQ